MRTSAGKPWVAGVLLLLASVQASSGQVVINEIHYDPVDHTSFEEFIELYNPGGTAIDISGWSLRDAVTYTFPPGTIIGASGYLIVAENTAVMASKYGATAFGPWSGKLSNDGEEVQLYDDSDIRIDRVDYNMGFPWPTLGDPWSNNVVRYNASMELINPELDNDLGGSWRSSGANGPTPGALNDAYQNAASVPPQVRQVEHTPSQPTSSDTMSITAKVTDPDGVSSVVLQYQLVEPGNYIPIQFPNGSPNPSYLSDWTNLTMYDDGTHGDALTGDSVYTVEMPENLQGHRNLVRYRIVVGDTLYNSLQVPYADDPQPNFTYFCYDGVPAWQASIQPGTTSAIDFGTNIMRRLPAVHLISRNDDVEQATWFERYMGDLYKWSGTLVYDGKVYDHIHYRARGGTWRYSMVKNMWKFDFNRGHDFQMRDDYGRKYDTKWTKLNLGACIQQNGYMHRGEQGMFESVGSRLFNLAGVPSFNTSFLQFRIIDDAQETPSNQYEGDFWGLYLGVEQLDGRFLDEHDLPDGNLYKMERNSSGMPDGELNNLGPLGPDDKSDLNYILNNYSGASDAWWTTNWKLDDYYSYQTIVQAIHHYDINSGKNYFYYRNPETGIWQVMPWDLDLTWADNMYLSSWGGLNALASRILDAGASGDNLTLPGTTRTAFRIAFRNRIREIRDLLFNTDQAWQLVDEQADLLRDPGSNPSFLDADRAMWDYNPKMDSTNYSPRVWQAGTGNFYQWPLAPEVSKDFEGCVQLMKDYVVDRGAILDALADDPSIPDTPLIVYYGAAGYPLDSLSFACYIFQGTGTFSAMQWRAGEVFDASAPAYDPTEPLPYEITEKWTSGEITSFSNTITIPADALKVGHAYRVRLRMRDNTGRWSHWSEPVEFITTEPSSAAAMASHLRISELMYDPPAGSDYEFVELYNASTNLTLDLGGAAFTEGIDFNFPSGSNIGPDSYLLVIGTTNTADFRSHYGLSTNVNIAGSFSGSLSNSGEELKLKSAPGGQEIVSFKYNNSRHWPLAATGAGHSMVPLSATGQATGALDYPGNWKASAYVGGSPGAPDPIPSPMIILNEITAHTDYSNPAHPEYDSDDWIEVYNPNPFTVSLIDCYLSDDPSDPAKWACPAIGIPSGGYVVFGEVADFHNPISTGFGLDKAGEQVLLSYLPGTSSDRVLDAVGFKGQENGRSLSRLGEYWYAAALSAGGATTSTLDGLRISEIMYNPAPLGTNDNTRDEYIEIHNPTDGDVTLMSNGEAWRINGGVEYTFPENTAVPAGNTLLIVGFDPSDTVTSNAFAAVYGITNAVRLFGPWSGKLGNRSEPVVLERPQSPDLLGEGYSWIVEDETVYGNQHPWPTGAAGYGSALTRLIFNQSGLDPDNWAAITPTPGGSEPSPFADQDGDGMSDYEEWFCGTNPNDPNSFFQLGSDHGTNLTWVSATGRVYTIYWTDDLTFAFVPIATGLPYPQNSFTDSVHSTNSANFYRIGVELE